MRVGLALSMAHQPLSEELRRWPELEVMTEVPLLSRNALRSMQTQVGYPGAFIISEDVPCGDVKLLEFIFDLRRQHVRVIFLAERSRSGDLLLHELSQLGVADILPGATFTLMDLLTRLRQQGTPAVAAEGDLVGTVPVKELRGVITAVGLGVPGVGVTTVATSLAAMIAESGASVALIDLDPRDSAVKDHLNLAPDHDAIAAVLQGTPPTRAGENAGGVLVFAPRPLPVPPAAAALPPPAIATLVDRVRAVCDRVVIDAGHDLDEPATQTAIQVAEEVLVVCDLDVHHSSIGIHKWPRLARLIDMKRVRLVVNRVSDECTYAKVDDVVDAFGGPRLGAAVPLVGNAPDALVVGKPLLQCVAANSAFAHALRTLAGLPDKQPERKGWFSRR